MLVFVPLIIGLIILVTWTTAPSRNVSSAVEAFKSGHIRKAEEYLKKVWTRRDDIPAHYAGMLFKLIKKGKLAYVKEAFNISQDGLSEDAKYHLKGVQKEIQKYIEDKASAAFLAEDYAEAIKFNETLIPFGRQFKEKDEEYRAYRELKNYLSSGRKGSALNIYLSDNMPLVVRCITNKVEELDSPLDALKLLSLALSNDEIKSQFESRVLKYVLEHDMLPELKADADKYQQAYLEDKADKMPETKIMQALRIYKALNFKKPSTAISEKIESLNYKRACSFIEKDDYKGFRLLQSGLKQNMDVTPGFRYDLGCKYNTLLFDYLSKILLSDGLKGEKWEDFLRCCTEYAATEKSEDVLKLAIALNAKGCFVESGKLCRLLNNSNPNVFNLVCSNVISLLELSSKYECLEELCDTVEVLPKLAGRCFDHADKLGSEGNYAKAVYIEKLAEPYYLGDDSKYDILITHQVSYAMSLTKTKLPAELTAIFSYLQKVKDKAIVGKHLVAIEGMASAFLTAGKAAEAYEVSKRIYDISKEASRIFLDSAFTLAKDGKLKDISGLSKAISMQDDILTETLRFIPFFPDKLRLPYVEGYAQRVVELYKENQQNAYDFYNQQEDLTLRGEILSVISKKETSVFKSLIIDILNDKEHKLPQRTTYAEVVAELIFDIAESEEKVLFFKDLVISGYHTNDYYVKAALAYIGEKISLEDKLDVVNESLTVADDIQFYVVKHEIATSLSETDPLKALSICTEIEKKVNVKDVQLKCYLKLAEEASSLADRHNYLSCALQKFNKSNKKASKQIASLALSLAKSMFISGNAEEGYAVCREFPSLETELLLVEHKFNDTKNIGGDAAAIKEIQELISFCDSSSNATSIYLSETYRNIWQEYTRRNISKASKQSADKAIKALISVAGEVKGAHFDSSDLHKTLAENISGLSYNLAHELEENSDYANAIKYYETSFKYAPSKNTASGRRAICLIKQGTLTVPQLKKEIDKVIDSVPRPIEKDIVYRFVLRQLQDSYVAEATKLAEERLRDNKLLDLCEAYRLRKVQSQINQLNERLELLREKKMDYNEAKEFYDGLEDMMLPLVSIFPENRYLVSEYKKAAFSYMLKMALKEEKYDSLYTYYREGSNDFIKDKTRFRNLAAVCIGMIEQGHLNDSNYKEVISIWLSAVYDDYLIVRSLDHTKWDDGYTFTLDDSLSQTYDYDDLPSNINFDSPNESNVSIGHVQKSLLERSDAALSDGKKEYYDFYLEQRKAMDAYSAVKFKELSPDDKKENIIAPYALINILPGEYATKMKATLKTGNSEHGLRIGYLYGFSDRIFAEYNTAVKYQLACISSAEKLTGVSTAFTDNKISSVRKFRNLYTQMVAEITASLDTHINDGKTYKKLCKPYCTICEVVEDDTLSYKFSEFINSQIIPLVNGKTLSTAEGLEVLYDVYKVYSENITLQRNISGMLKNVIGDYLLQSDTAGWGMISEVLNDTNDFNNDILDFLTQDGLAMAVMMTGRQSRLNAILDVIKSNDASVSYRINTVKSSMENAVLQKELGEIVEKVNNDTMSGITALQKVYAIYKRAKSDSRICENMAIIANRCIHEYIPSNKAGVSTVKNILDELFNNRSQTFNTNRRIFRDAIREIRSGMTIDQQSLLGLNDSPLSALYTSGQVLNANGERLKLAISYLKKFAND